MNPADDFFNMPMVGGYKTIQYPMSNLWGIGNLVIEENIKRLKEICEKHPMYRMRPKDLPIK